MVIKKEHQVRCLLYLPAPSPWDGTGFISFKSANLGAFGVPGAHQNPADASVRLKNVLPLAEPVQMVLGCPSTQMVQLPGLGSPLVRAPKGAGHQKGWLRPLLSSQLRWGDSQDRKSLVKKPTFCTARVPAGSPCLLESTASSKTNPRYRKYLHQMGNPTAL